MSSNFLTRVLTSIILLFILFIGLYLSKFVWVYLLIVVSMISFYEFKNLIKKKFVKKKEKVYFYNFFSLIYFIFFIYVGYYLSEFSSLTIIFILSICIFSDTGGYIIGKSLGGKKLTKISPNKTISGCFGSFFFSLFPIIIFYFIFDNSFIKENIFETLFLCLFLSLICQLGDLFISYFKRQARVKDTGNILPGHGGLLDRIDGIIFVLPVAYLIEKFFI